MRIYLEHKIKSAEDLPKVKGRYISQDKSGVINQFTFNPKDHNDIAFYTDFVNFWLEPVEVPELTEIEFDKAALDYKDRAYQGHFDGDDVNLHFKAGINWLKSKLKIFN